MEYSGRVMKVGNSRVLVLPKSLCDTYEIEVKQDLKIITTEGGFFVPVKPRALTPIKDVLENALKSLGGKGSKK
ncbi:MAG: AbrB/MazE/SpoVT family DNA-binding domain-containing protein [Nitrosotalea sp.]